MKSEAELRVDHERLGRELADRVKELERRHGYFVLQMPFGRLITLVAQLQLALRHPGNQGSSARDARETLDDIFGVLGKADARVAELLRLGDDPRHDVPRQGGVGS